MLDRNAPIAYLRLRRVVPIRRGQDVQLGHIAQMIAPSEYEQALRKLVIYSPKRIDGNRVLIDMLLIINKIKETAPELQIELFGEPHTLLEIGNKPKRANLLLVGLVWLLLFIGSGLTIMNFHADVNMAGVHRRIYELITGHTIERPLILQIPYSFGIGAGMIIFFNHLFKKKFNEEPSPLEVEMFMYQENVNHYVVKEEYQKIDESRKPV